MGQMNSNEAIEIGGGWLRILRFVKGEREMGHTSKIVNMSRASAHLVQLIHHVPPRMYLARSETLP